MIPTVVDLEEAYQFVARRWGVHRAPPVALLEALTREARTLAVDERDEPAAFFYACARRQLALPGLWTAVTGMFTVNLAKSLGLDPRFSAADLLPLYMPICDGRDRVRRRARLVRRAPRRGSLTAETGFGATVAIDPAPSEATVPPRRRGHRARRRARVRGAHRLPCPSRRASRARTPSCRRRGGTHRAAR